MARTIVFALSMVALLGCATSQPTADTPPTKEDSMMIIRVVVRVQPDQATAFRDYLAQEAKVVRQRPGCSRYELFEATGEANTFLLYEEWETAAAFEAYQKSPELKESFAVLGPMMAGPPDSAYYSAQLTK